MSIFGEGGSTEFLLEPLAEGTSAGVLGRWFIRLAAEQLTVDIVERVGVEVVE
jgi:hypothetical protein